MKTNNSQNCADRDHQMAKVEGVEPKFFARGPAAHRVDKEPHWCRAALDASPDAIFLIDLAGRRFDDVNRSACSQLGYSSNQLLSGEVVQVFPYLNLQELIGATGEADRREAAAALPTIMRHQDGTELFVELFVHTIDSEPTPRLICFARIHGDVAGPVSPGVFHDPLTGLPDRRIFDMRLRRASRRARRSPCYRFAVLFLDIDDFKPINDTLGHAGGDHLLRAFGRRLLTCMRPYDMVSRHGGDEFTILVDDMPHAQDAIAVAERIQQDLAAPFVIRGRRTIIHASIGIAIGSAAESRPDQLLDAADATMYRVKAAGGNGYAICRGEQQGPQDDSSAANAASSGKRRSI
jgi:diguanylate cyclase (GGDEF)-like protein/PAS domain S-box-containing protein